MKWSKALLFYRRFPVPFAFSSTGKSSVSFQTQLTKASFSNSLELSRLPSCFFPLSLAFALLLSYLLPCRDQIWFFISWISCLVHPEYLVSCLALNRQELLKGWAREWMNEWMGQGFTGWHSCCFKSSPPFYLHPSLFCEFQTGKREGKGEEDSFPIKVSLRLHRGDRHLEKRRLVGSEGSLNISKNCEWASVVGQECEGDQGK